MIVPIACSLDDKYVSANWNCFHVFMILNENFIWNSNSNKNLQMNFYLPGYIHLAITYDVYKFLV